MSYSSVPGYRERAVGSCHQEESYTVQLRLLSLWLARALSSVRGHLELWMREAECIAIDVWIAPGGSFAKSGGNRLPLCKSDVLSARKSQEKCGRCRALASGDVFVCEGQAHLCVCMGHDGCVRSISPGKRRIGITGKEPVGVIAPYAVSGAP